MMTVTHSSNHRAGVRFLLGGLALALLLANTLHAQVGDDNPTGPSGMFNGNVNTGGSYDPYTGNATRTITDLVITGAVGDYGLSFTRTSNSRRVDSGFGAGGGWQQPFAWSIDSVEDLPSGQPIPYTVNFPDGRVLDFSPAGAQNGIWRATAPGVPERLKPWDGTYCYLLLPDGGQVQFRVTWTSYYDGETHQTYYNFSFNAEAIIDPHGLCTTFSYNPDGSFQITEPAGRSIRIFYATVSGVGVIDRIQASDGREVHYTYSTLAFSPGTIAYPVLTNVTYYGDSSLVATYSYQAPNVGDANGPPLLASCDDPMYPGPMKRISYVYATGNNPDGSAVVCGQISSENSSTTGQAVSSLTVNNPYTRTETRGDGPFRTFTYQNGKVVNYTDFKGHTSIISYDGNGFTSGFEDARHHYTSTQREGTIGALSVLTHPDPEQSNQRFAYKQVNGGPYFLQIAGDERNFGSNTYFGRDDATNRVTQIWYPDYPNGPTEGFSYNGFGQIETHTMTSGGVENFRYDGRGLKYLSWPPATPSDPNPDQHPTQYFYYTSGPQMDRLSSVMDPRGYSTSFEYNTRGQVTKVTHVQDGTYAQNGYNPDGTLAWTADENHPNASWNVSERTRYTYDDYKRVIGVTNPMNETTTLSYAPPNGSGSYAHTTSSAYQATSPLNKMTTFDYDENFCRKMVRKGTGSPDDDGGTYFGYDEVGNLTSVQDPRGNLTTFGYDERNRRTSSTAPAPFNDQITKWEYDTRSNLTKETRPDLLFRRMEYNSVSQVLDTYGFANEHTHYERDLAGNVRQMTDPKPATYFFDYDAMNRKTGATYPMDATGATRSAGWVFDVAGNLYQYTNPANQTKTMGYDTRNRLISSSWDAGGGPAVGLGYYDNSQLGIIVTNNAVTNNVETTVVFGYDAANRQTWEEQTVAGYPTRRVETPRDTDGFRSSLNVPGWYTLFYDYTQRGQLAHIYDGGHTAWFAYSYDATGDMIKRQDVYGGVNDSTNIMDSGGVSQYDQLNRPMMWEQTGTVNGTHDSAFARSHFTYDSLSRLTASWRDEQAGKGDWFGYHATGQLTDVAYNADNVSSGTPQNATRTVNYTMTADTLNRSTMSDTSEVSAYTPNALNQYSDINGGGLYYDNNFNLMWTGGFSAGYDSENHLTAIGSGEDYGQFTYDGLGRCLKRTIDGDTTLIVYDGWKPVWELDEWNGVSWNIYGPGPDEILYRHDASRGELRYHLDRMGNVAFLLDSDGDGIERYTYDVFGKPTVTDWNGNNPRPYSWYGNRFMFTGREYFPELGIYDYRNRFYYPTIGRFLQTDPTGFAGGDINLFRYCGGDPVNNSDPIGTDLIVATYNTIPGLDHIGIGVYYGTPESVETWGFYSVTGQPGGASEVRLDPTDRRDNFVILQTSAEQDEAVLDFIEFVRNNPWVQDYSLFTNNCSSYFVFNALVQAGITVDKTILPNLLLARIKHLPNAVKPSASPTKTGQGNGGGGGDGSNRGASGVSGGFAMPTVTITGIFYPTQSQLQEFMNTYPNAQSVFTPFGIFAPGPFSTTTPGGGFNPFAKKKF